MLKIRLQRVGRVHEPSFRLVLTESQNSTKSGRFKEVLGSYDPRKSTEAFKADRIKYWLSKGVMLTGTVNNLLVRKGLIRGKKVAVSPAFAPVAPTAPAEALPVEVAPEATPVEAAPEAEVKSDTIEPVADSQ